ncbi:type I-E CRISPR-associated protein Cse1/CasA [Halomonas sp. G11]|uniref:type I-E CRISPR-associated protein Cse1/CasA n=1 Tax=Halomonas sp. G11 TaxID=1684425 RepID=UPI0008019B37|nr:type I-E CRISPR-associated protein Cse1/CasA [Halomonas sp. G11]OAZ98749.1 type I-E CRISPR-associated protein Cse1/CasA [Halomonas sp. G11]
MNLLDDPWLPFLLKDGEVENRPPSAVADSDVINLALPRADFQGAAYQFLIGLLQTALSPKTHDDWLDWLMVPPSVEALEKAFVPFSSAFELDGDGPRFMQDLDPLEDVKNATVSGLLIDAPGANGIKNNTDFFVKRGRVEVMCDACAAIALYTMQINAPAGGAGIRVGLRGGGPLTTLVMPESSDASLWERLWLNVITQKETIQKGQQWSTPHPEEPSLFFWMANTRVSDKKGTEVLPEDTHPLHAYWSMPRRFRLLFEDADECPCDICGRKTQRIVRELRAKKQGANYDGPWLHPLTPYRRDPKKPNELPLSGKGQPGGLGYRHWSGFVLNDEDNSGAIAAAVLKSYIEKQVVVRDARRFDSGIPEPQREARLWVFGYDMDNMKPRGWYSVEMPLVEIPPGQQERLRSWIHQLTELSRNIAWMVRTQVKNAWFSRPSDAKGDMSAIDNQFYDVTQPEFFKTLLALQQVLQQDSPPPHIPPGIAERWYFALKREAMRVFEELALSGAQESMDLERATAANRQLQSFLGGKSKGSKVVSDFIQQGGFDPSAQAKRIAASAAITTGDA